MGFCKNIENNQKRSLKKMLILSGLVLIEFLFSFSSCILVSNSYDYKIYSFSQEMYDNKTYLHDSYDSVIMSVKTKNIELRNNSSVFNNSFEYFYYNRLVKGVRCIFDNDIRDYSGNEITLLTQPTFSIRKETFDGGGHYVDFGMYLSYFGPDFIGNEYLFPRFGCDSFIFINDFYADYLIEKYDLNSYEDLICNEKYSVLNLQVDGNKSTKLSINNILYSGKREAGRSDDLFNYYGLVFNSTMIKSWSNFSFDIDLKSNPYLIKETINDLGKINSSLNDFDISFKTFNKNSGRYNVSNILTSKFRNIDFFNNNSIIFFIYVVIAFIFVGVTIIYVFWNSDLKECFLVTELCIFFVYGVVTQFINFYPFFNIIPIIGFLLIIGLCWKEVKNGSTSLFKKTFRTEKDFSRFLTIKI